MIHRQQKLEFFHERTSREEEEDPHPSTSAHTSREREDRGPSTSHETQR